MGIIIGVGIYLLGIVIGSLIKGLFFYRLDDDMTFLFVGLWPLALVGFIPVMVVIYVGKFLILCSEYLTEIGYEYKQKRRRTLEERERIAQTVNNIGFFEDDEVQETIP